MTWQEGVGGAVVVAGVVALVVAAAGLHRLPDALSRQHAGTKAVTFALSLPALGAALLEGSAAFAVRAVLLTGFLIVTTPVASHLLARAALREAGRERESDAAPVVGARARLPRD
jgi:multicomponent Na+:H+ antiporter subunit G